MTTATLEKPTLAADAQSARVEAPPERLAPRHRMLFTVPFQSAMTDNDVRRLSAAAGLDCDLHAKLDGDTVSPGVRRLDFTSGLFLVRGARAGQWRLEGRTWGDPTPGNVRRWRLWASAAAHVLDPLVPTSGESR